MLRRPRRSMIVNASMDAPSARRRAQRTAAMPPRAAVTTLAVMRIKDP